LKLIACPVCHTQYDVSQVDASEFTCRCGETLENRPLAPVDATVARCGACGAQVGAEAERCAYCGSDIVLELDKLSLICPECFARNAEDSRFCIACGVQFAPEALPVAGSELPCPACETRMPPSAVGGIAVNECPGCHGLWVAGDQFDSLVRRAAKAREERSAMADPPRVTGANPARQGLQYRRCPECEQFMLRVNYERSSGVILDECRSHGTWLDADELEQVAGFILSGGKTSPVLEETREKLSVEAAAAYARARVDVQSIRPGQRLGMGSGGGLLRVLFDLLT
jgi:Zn-finger nucleic acid-binding protein